MSLTPDTLPTNLPGSRTEGHPLTPTPQSPFILSSNSIIIWIRLYYPPPVCRSLSLSSTLLRTYHNLRVETVTQSRPE